LLRNLLLGDVVLEERGINVHEVIGMYWAEVQEFDRNQEKTQSCGCSKIQEALWEAPAVWLSLGLL